MSDHKQLSDQQTAQPLCRCPDGVCLLHPNSPGYQEKCSLRNTASQPAAPAEDARAKEVIEAAREYYMGYVQDEADDPELCVSEQHHQSAKRLRDALATYRGKP